MGMTLARILANRLARSSSWVLEEIKRGIIGRLDLITPVELIQAMNVNNQTGLLTVQSDRANAAIYFLDGQVADVQIGERRGEEAFFDFLAWSRGTFRFQPGTRDIARSIPGDTVGLLLEGMRRQDEARETERTQRRDTVPPA